jgi:hypothetical protein
MASYKMFAIIGFLLVTITIVIQSAPIDKAEQTVQSSSIDNQQAVDSEETSSTATTSSTTPISQNSLSTPELIQEKKKRYIDDDLLNGLFDSDSDEDNVLVDHNNHVLHTKIQETSAKIHDNADKPVDTDDSKVFSESQMTPYQLTNVIRQRRNVKLNDQSNRRRKRALSPYDFYDTDSFYDPYADLIEQQQQYDRPIRSFAPIYWYPSVYGRSLRSALAPSYYESSEWPRLYSNTIDDDNDDSENPALVYGDEEDYESNRYPILLEPSNDPFDNVELQQQYNTDDLPVDEYLYDNNDEDFEILNNDDEEEQYRSFYPKERSNDLWVF